MFSILMELTMCWTVFTLFSMLSLNTVVNTCPKVSWQKTDISGKQFRAELIIGSLSDCKALIYPGRIVLQESGLCLRCFNIKLYVTVLTELLLWLMWYISSSWKWISIPGFGFENDWISLRTARSLSLESAEAVNSANNLPASWSRESWMLVNLLILTWLSLLTPPPLSPWPPWSVTVDIRVLTLSILWMTDWLEQSLRRIPEYFLMKEAAETAADPPASCHDMRNWMHLSMIHLNESHL